METEPIRQHVIRRIFNMARKRGRPVTFRDIYATSGRDRDDLYHALKGLVEEGIVGMTDGSEGRGRPTTYFYLVNEWTTEKPDFFAGESMPPLIQTDRLNPDTAPDHRRTKEGEWQALMSIDDHEEYFQVLGPQIWTYVRDHDTDRDMVFKHFLGPQPSTEDRAKFSATYRRLTNAAYDEFYTRWWIRRDTIKAPQSGMKDRRFKTRLFTNDEPPVIDRTKSMNMQHQQDLILSQSDTTREAMRFPEPNDHIPDMSRFAATVKTISA